MNIIKRVFGAQTALQYASNFFVPFAYGIYDTASRDQERPWRGQKPRGAQQAGYLYPLQLVV
jgi:hypothetical protein